MKDQLKEIQERFLKDVQSVKDLKDLDTIRVQFLGKKGELTAALKGMGKLTAEERPKIGKIANDVRESIESNLTAQRKV